MNLITQRIFAVLILMYTSFAGNVACADWINLTGAETSQNIAEITVMDDHVKVVLELYIGDLEVFSDLVPDDWISDTTKQRPTLARRMENFSNNVFQIVTAEGVNLPAQLVLREPRQRVDRRSPFAGMINPYTKQRVAQAPDDKRVLYAELIYPFNGQPESLTFIPPLGDQGRARATVGFIAYHKSVPIVDFRYLGAPATVHLDWDDPWYTKFDNKNLTRHHKYPLMLYLYVEPRQVRLESLLRFGDIAELTEFNAPGSDVSIEDKYQLLQEHVKKYYADKELLQIDGDSFKPDSIRVEFLHATLSGLKVLENASSIDETSLLVGVSQRYYIERLPQKIESRWQYFNPRIDRIPVTVTDPAGPLPSFINKDDPLFAWENFLKKYTEPAIRPVVVETGWGINIPFVGETKIYDQMPDQQQALSIISGVLENLRAAFIEKEPAKLSHVLNDVLSTNDSKFLQKELAKLFSPKVTGGAVGAVLGFNDTQIVTMRELENPDGFSATISGSAMISARHWGHVDLRKINFQALLDLIEVDKQWRLADITVIDIKQVK
ncbi:MAG: hypothetical protein ACN4GR_02155 [Arenicellales bacterium]